MKKEIKKFSLKSLGRKIRAELQAHEANVEKKRVKRTIHKFGVRKRLGRGRYEPPQENVLVPAELPASLRQLPTTGESIFQGFKISFFLNFFSRSSKKPSTAKHYSNRRGTPTTRH